MMGPCPRPRRQRPERRASTVSGVGRPAHAPPSGDRLVARPGPPRQPGRPRGRPRRGRGRRSRSRVGLVIDRHRLAHVGRRDRLVSGQRSDRPRRRRGRHPRSPTCASSRRTACSARDPRPPRPCDGRSASTADARRGPAVTRRCAAARAETSLPWCRSPESMAPASGATNRSVERWISAGRRTATARRGRRADRSAKRGRCRDT